MAAKDTSTSRNKDLIPEICLPLRTRMESTEIPAKAALQAHTKLGSSSKSCYALGFVSGFLANFVILAVFGLFDEIHTYHQHTMWLPRARTLKAHIGTYTWKKRLLAEITLTESGKCTKRVFHSEISVSLCLFR
jgi:hypothetical protein